jgi:hypothetical protein
VRCEISRGRSSGIHRHASVATSARNVAPHAVVARHQMPEYRMGASQLASHVAAWARMWRSPSSSVLRGRLGAFRPGVNNVPRTGGPFVSLWGP